MGEFFIASDGKARCRWSGAAPEFLDYHDHEWGFPVDNDRHLFEKLCLESFQSGLSWRTILVKRDNFRTAFHNFDFEKIAGFTEKDVERLVRNEGIVRHRGKIEAVINNAKCAKQLVGREGSLGAFFWRYEAKSDELVEPQSVATSKESIALAKELKKMGWKFLGPTTLFAFLQAMGLVNDHVEGCTIRSEVALARDDFKRPAAKIILSTKNP